jgi:hypothetical protein
MARLLLAVQNVEASREGQCRERSGTMDCQEPELMRQVPSPEVAGSGLFARFLAAEGVGMSNPALGYVFATLAALVSGVSVYVNSLGVRTFADPVLYTALKDGFVGIMLLVPLSFLSGRRTDYRRLDRRAWAWMFALAITAVVRHSRCSTVDSS